MWECLVESGNGDVADTLQPEKAEDRKFEEAMARRRVQAAPVVTAATADVTGLTFPTANRKESVPTSPSFQCSEELEKRNLPDGKATFNGSITNVVFHVHSANKDNILS